MMKKLFPLYLLMCLAMSTFSQSYTYRSTFGSSGNSNGQFLYPNGVALDTNNNIYIADYSNNRIQKFNSNGTYLSTISGNGLLNPNFIAIDKQGNIYVTDKSSIKKYSSSGTYITKWGSSTYYGIAADTAGNIFAINSSNKKIEKYNSTGILLTQWGSAGNNDGEFDSPFGLAIDDSSNIYVVDGGNDNVQKFTSNGNFILSWGNYNELRNPQGIAIDASGDVYVTSSGYSNIQKFSRTGNYILEWGSFGTATAEFRNPYGIALTKSKDAYVVDNMNHRIQFFSYCPNPPQAPTTIYGKANVCLNSTSENYSVTNDPNVIGYTWTVPTGWQILSGQNTNTISVKPASYIYQNGDITVSAYDSCGASPLFSLAVKMQEIPKVWMLNKEVCANDSTIYDGGIGHATYSWSGPNNYSASTQKIYVNTPGTYKGIVTSIYGCTDSASASVSTKTSNCTNTQNYPWLWPSHRNWMIATNQYAGQIIDMNSGIQLQAGTGGSPHVNQYEGSTCASDDEGNLLFYSGGRQLFTGTGSASKLKYSGLLAGNEGNLQYSTSAVQGIITVRHPLNTSTYYIFTTDDANAPTAGLNYFTFDKDGNNIAPLGANRLGSYRTTEGIAATRHANGVDIWITVIESGTGKFNSYLLTHTGLNTTPVVSANAPVVSGQQERGAISFSYDSKFIAAASGNTVNKQRICVYKFDNSTGLMSEKHEIANANGDDQPYDVIFSPDGSKVYVSQQPFAKDKFLTHFDISSWGSDSLINSTRTLTTIQTGYNALEYAADGKLYITQGTFGGYPILQIEGNYDLATNLSTNALSGSIGSLGLPNMYLPPAEKIITEEMSKISINSSPVDISSIWLYSKINAEDPNNNNQYSGKGITDANKGIFNPQVAGIGTWKIKFERTIGSEYYSDSIDVTVDNSNSISIANQKELITISPNPAQSILQIKSDGTFHQIYIMNAQGQIIKNTTIQDVNSEISVENLAEGIYFLQVQNDKNVQVLKFVKNN